MAFDLSTATPIDGSSPTRPSNTKGFDLSTARPIDDSDVTSNADEGALAAGTRGAVEAVVPGFAGLAGFGAGMKAAAPVAARAAAATPGPAIAKGLVGGAVALTGGLAGAFGASSGAAWVQNKLYAIVDPEGYKNSQTAKEQHPTASAVGSVVGGLAGMSPKTIPEVAGKFFTKPIVQRSISAGLTGTLDVGQQAATEDSIDWTRAGAAAVGGFAAPGFNPAGKAAYDVGGKLVPGRTAPGGGTRPPTDSTEAPKPLTPSEAGIKKNEDSLIREFELGTNPNKQLDQAAFLDTTTGDYIKQGARHDELLKKNPDLIAGFLLKDGTFVTRKEAATIAKDQHADKLVNEIDPKRGLHSDDFGPERMDALKAKDFATFDSMQPGESITLYRGETKENEAGGQWWTTDPNKAAKYGKVEQVTLTSETIGKHAAQGHGGPNEFVFPTEGKRPADLVKLEPKSAVQKEDDIFWKYEKIKQQHEDALASSGKYSKEQIEALNQQRLSLRDELLSAKLATIKDPVLRKMAFEASADDPFLNSNNISNVGDLVRHLKGKFGDNHYISQMLDVLNVDPHTNTFVLSVDEFKRQAQKYGASLTAPAFWNDQGIFIAEGRGTNAIVVAHEIGHAALATKIEQIQALPANHPDAVRLKKLVSNIENILADVKSKVDLNKLSISGTNKLFYALSDVHEFISDGLFQPTVIQELMAIDRANPNLGFIDKILKAVSDFFGMNSKQYTAFHDLIASVSKLSEVDMPNTAAYMQAVDPNSTAPRPSFRGASPESSSSDIKTIKEKYDPRKEELYEEINQFSNYLNINNWKLVGKNRDGEIIYENRATDVAGPGGEYSDQIAEIDGKFYKYSEEYGMAVGKGYKSLDDLLTNSEYVDYGIKARQDLKEYEEYAKRNKPTSSKDTAPSSNSIDVKYEDKPGSDLENWKQKVLRLHKETSASEKQSDPDTWTSQEKAAWKSGDWKEFSRLRGYSEKEIKVFQEYLDTVKEGADKHGWSLEDIQSWELFGERTISSKESGAASASPDPVAVDPRRYDPRRVTDEADLKLKGKELYASKGEAAAREFIQGYERYKQDWLDPVKFVEDSVELNINNQMAIRRNVTNNAERLKEMVPDAATREQVAIAIDAKKTDTLTGPAKALADKYTSDMKDIGERALKEGVVKGLLTDYVTHIVNWADFPKGALDTFLGDVFKTAGDSTKKMSPESRFGMERKIETFTQLERVLADINDRIALAGKDFKLEIKTKDIAEIYKQYGLSMEKAIENKKLVESVLTARNPAGESLIRRVTDEAPLPRGWEMINDRQFAGYAVHPDLAPALKFAFETKGGTILNGLYTVSQAIKRLNVIASFFHAKSLLEVLSSTGTPIYTPLKEVGLGIVDKVQGTELSGIRKAVEQFKKGGLGDSVDKWIRGGLVLEIPQDVKIGVLGSIGKFADSMIGKYGPKTHILESALTTTEKYTLGITDKITWDYLHTGGKLYVADKYLERARIDAGKKGIPFDEAASRKEITSFVNKAFGGLNWFQEARSVQNEFGKRMAMAAYSPEGRKYLQLLLFAPDWTISTIKAFTAALPKELNPLKMHPIEGIRGMATPSTQADYARLYQFKTAITYLTLLNGINLLTADRPIWENKDPTRIEFDDGTSMQAMKHAMEPYHWIADPAKTLTNKLGFLPKAAIVATTGLEYPSPYAPKIVDPSAFNRAKAIASMALPFQVSAAMSAPEGEGLKRALYGTGGIPLYGSTPDQIKAKNKERNKQIQKKNKEYREREREAGR